MYKQDILAKFGPIWGASGVQGFFGEGYPYHRYAKFLGLDFTGLTFVAKTTTLLSNKGNMPLGVDLITPVERMPKCIYVSPRSWLHGSALNAVALSGPGIDFLISRKMWQRRYKPFFISIMAIESDDVGRFSEMALFCENLKAMLLSYPHLRQFLGIQINYSCPNTGHDMERLLRQLVEEAKRHLSILSCLQLPLVPKISVLLPVECALEIGNDPNCAGLTLSNTIPWEKLLEFGIDRKKIFGSDESPLIKRGLKQAGGYSGSGLLPLVVDYIKRLRGAGFKKHVNAGGGILNAAMLPALRAAGADSFSIGSVAFLRPWEVQPIIRYARNHYSVYLH